MNPDPLAPPPPPKVQGPDSFTSGLATAATSRKGRSIAAAALPYLLSVFTAVAGWAGGKLDTKVELEQAIELRREDKARAELEAQRHAQVLSKFDALDTRLFAVDQRAPGRVTQLERDQSFAWRAITEVRAATYATETASTKSRKEAVALKFAHSFDLITQKETAAVAYDQLFRKAAVE